MHQPKGYRVYPTFTDGEKEWVENDISSLYSRSLRVFLEQLNTQNIPATKFAKIYEMVDIIWQ